MTTDEQTRKAYDELDRLNLEVAQHKKLDAERKLREKAEAEARRVQRHTPTALQATSLEFRWNALMSWLWLKQHVSEEDLMNCYREEQKLFAADEAKQRAVNAKAQALADAEKEKHRLELLKLEYPFRRIEQPKGWAKEDWFKLNETTGRLEGKCSCGHQFSCVLQPGQDSWWTLTHAHRWTGATGESRGEGMKIGNSVGCWLDKAAAAYALLRPSEPLRLSDSAPQEFLHERPIP